MSGIIFPRQLKMRHEKLFRTNQAERKWESIRVSVFKTLDYPTRKKGHGERRAKKNSNERIFKWSSEEKGGGKIHPTLYFLHGILALSTDVRSTTKQAWNHSWKILFRILIGGWRKACVRIFFNSLFFFFQRRKLLRASPLSFFLLLAKEIISTLFLLLLLQRKERKKNRKWKRRDFRGTRNAWQSHQRLTKKEMKCEKYRNDVFSIVSKPWHWRGIKPIEVKPTLAQRLSRLFARREKTSLLHFNVRASIDVKTHTHTRTRILREEIFYARSQGSLKAFTTCAIFSFVGSG